MSFLCENIGLSQTAFMNSQPRMNQQISPQPVPAHPVEDDEIDLRQLVSVLWKQKNLIIGISIIGVALGAGAALLSTKYVTEGLFLAPGLSNATPDISSLEAKRAKFSLAAADFKRYENIVQSGARFETKRSQFNLSAADFKQYENIVYSGARLEEYLRTSLQIDTPDGQRLVKVGRTPNGLRSTIHPEFALTDKDQKDFGIKADDGGQNALIGLRLRYEDTQPTNGSPLPLLAEFVRDSIIRITAEAETLQKCAAFRAKEQELRNEQIQSAFEIGQEEKRAQNLREIIARNPGAAETRQIVSVERGTERFLSPAAQLVAAEVQISDLRLEDAIRKRERVASELKRQYYCDANATLSQPVSGRGFLEQLVTIQNTTFSPHDKTIDIIEQTWNELDLERTQWNNTFLSSMRFVAPPAGNEIKQRKPGLPLAVPLGGILGGMLGVMLALIRGWWRGDPGTSSSTRDA